MALDMVVVVVAPGGAGAWAVALGGRRRVGGWSWLRGGWCLLAACHSSWRWWRLVGRLALNVR